MRAAELTPYLASKFGIDGDLARRIDRALANAGLRRIAKGRAFVDMDQREALIFLIGCMVSDQITKAAAEVELWIGARAEVNAAPDIDPDWSLNDIEDAQAQHFSAVERELAGLRDGLGEVSLIDFLMAVCNAIRAGDIKPRAVRLMFNLADLEASFEFSASKKKDRRRRIYREERFLIGADDKGKFTRPGDPKSAISRGVWVHGKALIPIIENT